MILLESQASTFAGVLEQGVRDAGAMAGRPPVLKNREKATTGVRTAQQTLRPRPLRQHLRAGDIARSAYKVRHKVNHILNAYLTSHVQSRATFSGTPDKSTRNIFFYSKAMEDRVFIAIGRSHDVARLGRDLGARRNVHCGARVGNGTSDVCKLSRRIRAGPHMSRF